MRVGNADIDPLIIPPKVATVDIETTGLSYNSQVLTIGLAIQDKTKPEDGRYTLLDRMGSAVEKTEHAHIYRTVINLGKREMFEQTDSMPMARDVVQRYIQDADWIVFHNGSFDIPYLVKLGLLSYDQLRGRVFDTLVMARCTGPHNGVSHADLIQEYGIQMPIWYYDTKKKRSNLASVPAETVFKYNAEDVTGNLSLFNRIWPLAVEQYGGTPGFIKDEGTYVCIVSNMRTLGIPIDVEALIQHRRRATQALHQHARTLASYGIASKSNNDVARFVKSRGFQLPKTDKGNDQADEDSLLTLPGMRRYSKLIKDGEPPEESKRPAYYQELSELGTANGGLCEVLWALLEVRSNEKQLSTWIDGFQEEMDDNNTVHPLWSAAGTVSDRLTCTEPGAQAVPKWLRMWAAYTKRILWEADYQQAELRFGAAIAGEDEMAVAFANKEDIHQATANTMTKASGVAIKRDTGKRANFTGFYGGGAKALAEALGIPETEAAVIINYWRGGYKNVWKVSKKAEQVWKERGYLLLSHGKRLWASEDDLRYRVYKAFNQLVQGSISQIIKRAMLTIDREMPDALIRGQVHDALLLDTPDDGMSEYWSDGLRNIMVGSAPAKVMNNTRPPIVLEVDIKQTYPKKEKINGN